MIVQWFLPVLTAAWKVLFCVNTFLIIKFDVPLYEVTSEQRIVTKQVQCKLLIHKHNLTII